MKGEVPKLEQTENCLRKKKWGEVMLLLRKTLNVTWGQP